MGKRTLYAIFTLSIFLTLQSEFSAQSLREHYNQLALEAYYIKDLPLAEEYYSKIIALNPKDSVAWGDRGFIRDENCDYSGAIADFSTQIAIDKNSVDSYFIRGMVYEKVGLTEKALSDYHTVVSLESDNSDAHYFIGLIELQKGNESNAKRAFKMAIKANPQNAKALASIGWFTYCRNHKRKGRTYINRALPLVDENTATAHFYSALMLVDRNNCDAALIHFSKSFEQEPYVLTTLPSHDFDRRLRKKWDQFSKELICKSSLQPSRDSLNLAKMLLLTGNIGIANSFLNPRMDDPFTNLEEKYWAAVIAYKKGNFSESLGLLNILISLKEIPQFYLEKARVLKELNSNEEACKSYMNYLKLTPATSKIETWKECLNVKN